MLYPQKNLIKGFSSYIPNGVFIQQTYEEYRVLAKSTNPTTSNGYWLVDVKPNTNYTFSMERPSNMDIGVFSFDATRVLGAYTTIGNVSFNSGDNKQVRCYVKGANPNEIYELSKPMLKEGGSDVFEPYKLGNKPAVLYPSINLVNPDISKWKQGSLDSAGNLTGGSTRLVFIERIKMIPNAKYTVKINNGYRVFMRNFSDQTVEISNSGWLTDGATFVTPSNIKTAMLLISRGDDTGLNVDEVAKALPMLAQGEYSQNIPYKGINKTAALVPEKNLLKETEKIDTSNIWIKENGVKSCIKLTEKYKDNPIYRITFEPTKNGRVYQLFDQKGILSAGVWIRYIQYDTTLLLTLREANFGTSAGLTSINTDSPSWQYIKLENANVQTNKPYMFCLYKSGMTQTRDVIVDVCMPQLERGALATNFKPYQEINKPAVTMAKKNLIKPFGDKDFYYRPLAENNFTVISPRRLELNATADHQYFRFPFPVKRNTTYTVSAKHNGKLGIYSNDGASGIVDYTTAQKATFNSGNRDDIRVYWTNLELGNGKFFIEDLIVSEGTDTTYEPYTPINKPAVLYPEKNLLPPYTDWTKAGSVTFADVKGDTMDFIATNAWNGFSVSIPAKPLQNYYFSNDPSESVSDYLQFYIRFFDANGVRVSGTGASPVHRDRLVWTPAGTAKMQVTAEPTTLGLNILLKAPRIQLEEGSTPTSITSYKLRNKPL